MKNIDFNPVIRYLISSTPRHKLDENIILQISQDNPEGVEHDYLIIRLQLLEYDFNIVQDLNVLIWKLIDRGLLELTIDRKIKFIKQKEN